MRHILFATHGTMASGMQTSIELICGKRENVTYMDFYIGEDDSKRLSDYMETHGTDEEIIICTDMFNGSVSQKFLPYLNRSGIHLITGINLPMALEVVLCDEPLTKEVISEFIRVGHEQLYYVDMDKFLSDGHEDFF